MTDPAIKGLQKKGTSRHFLLSRTDTRSLDDLDSWQTSELDEALKARFPNIETESVFVGEAAAQMETVGQFAAMAIRCDRSETKKNDSQSVWSAEDWIALAEIVQEFCPQNASSWGLIRPNTFAACCAELDAKELLRQGRLFQQTVSERTRKSVTIGIAEYPCITYSPSDVLENTLKALDHAAFFGPDSAVIFDAVSLNISGDHYYDRGDFGMAITEFERALSLDEANVNVYNSLGVCFGILGQHDKAKASFRKALELDANEYMAIYNLGQLNLLQGNREQALENFIEANDLRSGVFEIVFQTGKLYLENGAPDKSQPHLEEARRLNPGSSQVFRYLGECYSALGSIPEAIDAYQKAIRANPNDATSLSALGCLLDEQGENPEIAIVFCQESVSLAPENAQFRHRLGTLYMKHAELDKALREFRKAELLGFDSSEDIQTIKERKTTIQ